MNAGVSPPRHPLFGLARRAAYWLATTVATVFLLVAFAGYGASRCGSIPAALDYVRGDRLLVDARVQSLGPAPAGSSRVISYTLRNFASHSIAVQGARTSCACAVVTDVPFVIEPGGSHTLGLSLVVSGVRERLDGSFTLYTDDPDVPKLELGYVGRVLATESGLGDQSHP